MLPVRVIDATNEAKTAINLKAHVLNTIHILETDWKVTVIGFASDASGESRKARADLGKEFPYLFVPDCLAHQVKLTFFINSLPS